MAMQDALHSRIAMLEERIREYQRYISDININIDLLSPKYDYYSTDTNINIKEYDVTSSELLLGNETSGAISEMENNYSISNGFLEEVESHINDLLNIIQILENLISECIREIDRLNEEINSISGGELG